MEREEKRDEEKHANDRRMQVLGQLGDGGVSLAGQTMVTLQSTDRDPPRPGVEKLRAQLRDGSKVFGFWFALPYRHVQNLILLPVSVGCELRQWGEARRWQTGCKFCFVGGLPFKRYLTEEEMLGFVRLALQKSQLAPRYWRNSEGRIVVLFSSGGEPLLCYDAVTATIRRLQEVFRDKLLVSVSTAGIADGIRRLLKDDLRVQLRFSLHSPTDEERQQFMPVRDDIETVLTLGVQYAQQSGIPLMVKYILIAGVNDSEEHAQTLVRLLRPHKKHIWVRISRLNHYGGELRAPSRWKRKIFVRIIRNAGLRVVPIWRGFATLGCDISHYIR